LAVDAKTPALRLGTLPVISTRTAYEIYQPLINYLAKGQQRPVELETPPDFKSMYRRIREGGFDLLVSPPHIARLAQKRFGWQPVVSCQPEHKSVLLVMDAGGASDLEGLKGKTIAVLDKSALVVMIMMNALAKHGLAEDRDFKVMETRSYESSQIAVKQGVAQAMVSRNQGFIDPNDRDRMRVLFEAGILPGYVFIASPAISRSKVQALRRDLLSFVNTPEARPFTKKLGYEGFATVTEEGMRQLDPYLEATEAMLN
jgi:phosphonate transport system substrate-binding protein